MFIAEYCDEHVSLCVRLSVSVCGCPQAIISRTARQIFTKILTRLIYTYGDSDVMLFHIYAS